MENEAEQERYDFTVHRLNCLISALGTANKVLGEYLAGKPVNMFWLECYYKDLIEAQYGGFEGVVPTQFIDILVDQLAKDDVGDKPANG